MSLPFQPKFFFRRRLAAPVPASFGADYSAGLSGFGRNSLTPRTDWATPKYVRDEPLGITASRRVVNAMGGFGEAGVDCVHQLNLQLRGLLNTAIKSVFSFDPTGLALSAIEGGTGNLVDLLMKVIGNAESAGFQQLAKALQDQNVADFKVALISGLMNVTDDRTIVNAFTSFVNSQGDKLYNQLLSALQTCGGVASSSDGGGNTLTAEDVMNMIASGAFDPTAAAAAGAAAAAAAGATGTFQSMTPAQQAAFLQSVQFQPINATAKVLTPAQKQTLLKTLTMKTPTGLVAKPQSSKTLLYAGLGLGAVALFVMLRKKGA